MGGWGTDRGGPGAGGGRACAPRARGVASAAGLGTPLPSPPYPTQAAFRPDSRSAPTRRLCSPQALRPAAPRRPGRSTPLNRSPDSDEDESGDEDRGEAHEGAPAAASLLWAALAPIAAVGWRPIGLICALTVSVINSGYRLEWDPGPCSGTGRPALAAKPPFRSLAGRLRVCEGGRGSRARAAVDYGVCSSLVSRSAPRTRKSSTRLAGWISGGR